MGAVAIVLPRSGPPDPRAVGDMLEAAPHRGDRNEVETLGRAAFGVCNDPDWVTGTLARDRGRLVMFCGTLDNEAELRAALRREGAPAPEENTPAATLLTGLAWWGDDVVRRLRGSFAGAITDGREVRCFRDHFGTRPLFHHDGPAGFWAATEVKQVLAGAPIPREPDLDHLHRLLYGAIERSTAYRGVERVPQRVLATAGPRPGLVLETYWEPSEWIETARLGPEAALEGTVESLDRAVSRVLTGGDVILLSGGLDSPSLAAFGARAASPNGPVRALTSIYPNHPTVDEREWTQLAADHVGMPLHDHVARAGSLDDLDHWLTLLDGPVPVLSIPESAEIYSEARALGARTVITGEMAERLFEGRGFLLEHLLFQGRLRAAARMLAQRRKLGRPRLRIAMDVARALVPEVLMGPSRSRRPNTRLRGLPSWVDPEMLIAETAGSPVQRMSPRHRWRWLQASPFIGPSSGFEADEICAACCGVDCRRPFADVDLWEFVLSLPAEVKFPTRQTKPLLREAMRGLLPDELIDRKDKTYFDEFHLATADYGTLERLLVDPTHRLEGIDYRLLRDRLRGGEMRLYELQWARNVARVHAFLDQW